MTGLTPSARKMRGRRLLGVALIVVGYFTAFLLMVALVDPFSPGPHRIGNASLITIASVLTVAIWAASGFLIRKLMMNPQSTAFRPWIPYAHAAVLLFMIPAISAFLAWKF